MLATNLEDIEPLPLFASKKYPEFSLYYIEMSSLASTRPYLTFRNIRIIQST